MAKRQVVPLAREGWRRPHASGVREFKAVGQRIGFDCGTRPGRAVAVRGEEELGYLTARYLGRALQLHGAETLSPSSSLMQTTLPLREPEDNRVTALPSEPGRVLYGAPAHPVSKVSA